MTLMARATTSRETFGASPSLRAFEDNLRLLRAVTCPEDLEADFRVHALGRFVSAQEIQPHALVVLEPAAELHAVSHHLLAETFALVWLVDVDRPHAYQLSFVVEVQREPADLLAVLVECEQHTAAAPRHPLEHGFLF